MSKKWTRARLSQGEDDDKAEARTKPDSLESDATAYAYLVDHYEAKSVRRMIFEGVACESSSGEARPLIRATSKVRGRRGLAETLFKLLDRIEAECEPRQPEVVEWLERSRYFAGCLSGRRVGTTLHKVGDRTRWLALFMTNAATFKTQPKSTRKRSGIRLTDLMCIAKLSRCAFSADDLAISSKALRSAVWKEAQIEAAKHRTSAALHGRTHELLVAMMVEAHANREKATDHIDHDVALRIARLEEAGLLN